MLKEEMPVNTSRTANRTDVVFPALLASLT